MLSQNTLYYFLKNCNISVDKKIGDYHFSKKILSKLGFLEKKFIILFTSRKLDYDKLYKRSIILVSVNAKKGLEKYHFALAQNGIKNGYVSGISLDKALIKNIKGRHIELQKLYKLMKLNNIKKYSK